MRPSTKYLHGKGHRLVPFFVTQVCENGRIGLDLDDRSPYITGAMTYFLYISLPILMGIALVASWLRVMPYLAVIGLIIFIATWMFG